jgi:hypothetical protein
MIGHGSSRPQVILTPSVEDTEGFGSIPYTFGSKPYVGMARHTFSVYDQTKAYEGNTFSVYDQPKASVKVSFDPCSRRTRMEGLEWKD